MNIIRVEENSAVDIRYAVAGWLAIASATLFLPAFFITVLHDIGKAAGLLPFVVLLYGLQTAFSVYAFYQFKNLLNEYYEFHETDNLIIILIIAQIVIVCFALLGRIFPVILIPSVIMLVVLGIPTGIVGIIFGVKLLRLNASLHGFLKPLAYLSIAGSICMLTFLLIPIGLIIFAVSDAILGAVFLKGKEGVKVEYV